MRVRAEHPDWRVGEVEKEVERLVFKLYKRLARQKHVSAEGDDEQ
jgi:hypothetical protein